VTSSLSTVVRPLAISACGVISSGGPGLSALGDLLEAARSTTGPAPDASAGSEEADYPPMDIRKVSFEPAEYLGRKGLRNIDRLTALGMTACKLVLDDAAGILPPDEVPAMAVVMGTSTGSTGTFAELAYDSLTQERPYLINPSHFPNAVMNACAGQIAIRNTMEGPNVTVAGGTLSSLFAFRYARNLIDLGRVSHLLVGGVEELNPVLAWGWYATGKLPPGVPLGEGCVVFLVEDPAERRADAPAPLAELHACEVRYCGPVRQALMTGLSGGLAGCITRALERSAASPDEVTSVSLGATGDPTLVRAEKKAVTSALGRLPDVIQVTEAIGETYSVAGSFQLAALLAVWQRAGATPGVSLVTAIGRDGNVGAMVVRPAG
jgi:3-oxoacyl-[acyl-carrier-protein] synthase II